MRSRKLVAAATTFVPSAFAGAAVRIVAVLATGAILMGGCPPNPQPVACNVCFDAPAVYGHTAAQLPDGRVLVIGGFRDECPAGTRCLTPATSWFDPSTETFEPGPEMVDPRAYHAQVQVDSGDVVVIGGTGLQGALASVEVFRVATGQFETLTQLTDPASVPQAFLLDALTVAVRYGALVDGIGETVVELVDVSTGTTRRIDVDVPIGGTTQSLGDGRFVMYGDQPEEGTGASSAVVVDPSTEPPTTTASLGPFPSHSWAASALLSNGSIAITGGVAAASEYGGLESPLHYEFDPNTGTFTARAPMTLGRGRHLLVPTPSGDLVAHSCGYQVTCGTDFEDATDARSTLELWSQSTDSWRVSIIGFERSEPSVTVLVDGRVLVIGGQGQLIQDGYGGLAGPLPHGQLITP